MKKVAAVVLILALTLLLVGNALAAQPYTSVQEFVQDNVNKFASAATIAGAYYTVRREVARESVAIAAVRAGGAFVTTTLLYDSLIISPRLSATVRNLFR